MLQDQDKKTQNSFTLRVDMCTFEWKTFIYKNYVFSHLIIKVHDNGGVEKGWDGVEDSNIDAVCDQQHDVARV